MSQANSESPGAFYRTTEKEGYLMMLLCRKCGNNWPETVPKAVPPKHCPKCGAPEVIRHMPPPDETSGNPGF